MVGAKRSLGQHFLASEAVVRRMIESCRFMASQARGIVEVGPGRGALTGGLAALGKPLWLVELDDALGADLARRFPEARLSVADARTFDWHSLSRISGLFPWFLVGNLPYNAGTEILRQALASRETLVGMVVMLQREVAAKFCAGAGEGGYGPLAAWADPWWDRRILFTVPPGAFAPAPKVTSAVCAFQARSVPGLPSGTMWSYWDFLQGAFRHPRKTLASNLSDGHGEMRERWIAVLGRLGHPPSVRPAQVNPEDLARLYAHGPSG